MWAAGIRAPAFLATLGLETSRSGAVVVDTFLRAAGAADVYALGDCAACTDVHGTQVPPRAQAAHPAGRLPRPAPAARGRPAGRPAASPYVYRDYGSLVSFGHSNSVGSLMGSLKGLSWFVDGFVARLMYTSLHLMHHQAVLGTVRTAVLAVARFLIKRSTALVKLH